MSIWPSLIGFDLYNYSIDIRIKSDDGLIKTNIVFWIRGKPRVTFPPNERDDFINYLTPGIGLSEIN